MEDKESEREDIWCASSALAGVLLGQVNQSDVESMIQAQKHMMLRFEKTNEMLINCSALSAVRYHIFNQEFKRHTNLLLEMKKDLDTVFRRIRNLKLKLSTRYPEAFKACSSSVDHSEGNSEDDKIVPGVQELPSGDVPDPVTDAPACSSENRLSHSSSCSQTTTPSPTNSTSTSDSG